MPKRVLAVTIDGRISYCSCPPNKRGYGRCNHVAHQEDGEKILDFMARTNIDCIPKSLNNPAINADFNQESFLRVQEALSNSDNCIFFQATGTGKSSIFTALADSFQDEKCVLISPSLGINEQFEDHNQGNSVMDKNNLVTLTYQKILSSYNNGTLNELCDDYGINRETGLLMLDEVHHLVDDSDSKKWGKAIDEFMSIANKKGCKVVGATATLKEDVDGNSHGEKILDNRFKKNIVGDLTVEKAFETGALVMPEVITNPYGLKEESSMSDLEAVINKMKSSSGQKLIDYKYGQCKKLFEGLKAESDGFESRVKDSLERRIEEYDKKDQGTKIVIFCGSNDGANFGEGLDEVEKIKIMFHNKEIETNYYHSGANTGENKKFFDRFKSNEETYVDKDGVERKRPYKTPKGKIEILRVNDCFNEGIHPKDLTIAIKTRSTKSQSVFDQQNGRVLDMMQDKPSLIIDRSGDFANGTFHEFRTISKISNEKLGRTTTYDDSGFGKARSVIMSNYYTSDFYSKASKIANSNTSTKDISDIPLTGYFKTKVIREDAGLKDEQIKVSSDVFIDQKQLKRDFGSKYNDILKEIKKDPECKTVDGKVSLIKASNKMFEKLESIRPGYLESLKSDFS